MSSDAREQRRGSDLALTLVVLLAIIAVLLPITRVVSTDAWFTGSVLLAFLILSAGWVARRYRLAAVAVSLIEAAVWVGVMTAVFFAETALLWVIPTPASIRVVPSVWETAMAQIVQGSAPLEPTTSLSMVLVGATGLLTIIVDHVVLTARMPLLAAVGLIAVSLIPSIAVPPDEIDVMWFVVLACAILLLMRLETRSRETPTTRVASRSAGVPATALGIGAIAVVVAVVLTPLLPQPAIRAGAGSLGVGPGIDASLRLGDDLRRPDEVEVLRVRTDSASAPYLRATTLSEFNGEVWEPDHVRTIPIDSEVGLGPLGVSSSIPQTDYTTAIQVMNLSSPWLLIPYPAISIEGLDGVWGAAPYNRTVLSRTVTTQGQDYQVVSRVPKPTLEQVRTLSAHSEVLAEATSLPEEMPEIIAQTAGEITAGSTNDYDALIALQRWFRSPQFGYSLDAPVEDGFDGNGADAVATFLEVRRGYCVHFASAFAIMARTLGMPSRIVIGYLPGVDSGDPKIDGQTVYTVSSAQLHAWPEVYFDGLGWVPFEPTNGLGSPTNFLPAASLPGSVDDPLNPSPTPSVSASDAPRPDADDPQAGDAAGGGSRGAAALLPVLGVFVAMLVLLSIPGVIGAARRARLLRAARRGDAAAAWSAVQNAAIDVGVPVPTSESPRAWGGRLIGSHGAPAREMGLLVGAIEQASYAPQARIRGDAVASAAESVGAALLRSVPTGRRMLAVAAPRSLVIRPGTTYAGAGVSPARARS